MSSYTSPFFASQSFKTLALCRIVEDQNYLDIIKISTQYNIAVVFWNCSKLIEIDDSIIVFLEPEVHEISLILKQPGVQKSLSSNVWLMFSSHSMIHSIPNYFKNSVLAVGLNANIFFVRSIEASGFAVEITQMLGTGTKKGLFKVCKYLAT